MNNSQIFYSKLARSNKMCDRFEYWLVIRGHHIYSFMPTIGKTLQSQRELNNDYDSLAVAKLIIENDTNIEPPYYQQPSP